MNDNISYQRHQITIFIFDSGVGGLSILNYIKNKISNVNFIYLLDNAYFPYGNKSKDFIKKRLLKILYNIINNYNITLAIIGCNTASVSSLPYLNQYFSFPIIGVTPVLKTAIKVTKNNIIGLLATETTINSCYIKKQIRKLNYNNKYTIQTFSSPELVLLAEQKALGQSISQDILLNIFNNYNKFILYPDTIILGCTHFILLKNELTNIFPNTTNFLDSNKTILHILKKNIIKKSMISDHIQHILLYTKNIIEINNIKIISKKYGFNIFKKIKIL
ncbi:glutamate racemase [Enterobacteriaceae endosymbiont of Neohaemonia nigricornis]|uniref:glutamate racemase n=1 Tax=Enterobacteriaceae endosymbiont of Neohaemonia nigricornis TaxID=2675792 RepID=UPI001449B964|nr:glutamate racemase [Enterobacteriaceae endosymbiont of Neohaemonia nigricornis]QJC30529.1 glutamate racemase [Enterobacteriaceae endosymbiont of Neohaemonia nigricornis]